MKNRGLTVILCCLFLTSCSKSETETNNVPVAVAISATIDGTYTTFKNASVVQTNTAGNYSINIRGYQGLPGSYDQMVLWVNGPDPIIPNEYSGDLLTPNNNKANMSYEVSSTKGYAATGLTPDTCNIVITSLSPSVKGTFKGTLLLRGGTERHTVTNGIFDVAH